MRKSVRRLPLILAAIAMACGGLCPASGQDAAADADSKDHLALAESALADGLYDVAANNFGKALDDPTLKESQRQSVEKRYVESLVRAGSSTAALEYLGEISEPLPGELYFWRAMALMNYGRLADAAVALKNYQQSDDKTYQLAAGLARAEVLFVLREPMAAAEVLEQL